MEEEVVVNSGDGVVCGGFCRDGVRRWGDLGVLAFMYFTSWDLMMSGFSWGRV